MSNIIDKIQVSGVTYDIQGSGGGGITVDPTLDSGSTNPVANSAITTALDAKVNVADNAVSTKSIMYAYDKGDTAWKYPYNQGLRINQFFVKYTQSFENSNVPAWNNPMYITNGGSTTSQIYLRVNASNYQITSVASTSGDFTYALEGGQVNVTLPDGYYISSFAQKYSFQILYPKYVINGGQSAQALQNTENVLNDIYSEMPKRWITGGSISCNSTNINSYLYDNNGNSNNSSIQLGTSIKGDSNTLDVYFDGQTIHQKILNTGSGNYCDVPNNVNFDYVSNLDEVTLFFNSAYTGSNTSYTIQVNVINPNTYTYSDYLYYDVANHTLDASSANYVTAATVGDDYTYSIRPKQEYFNYRIVRIRDNNYCNIAGVDNQWKEGYIITGVTTPSYSYQAQEIIDDLYSKVGSGITSGEVQTMIDESISGKADTNNTVQSVGLSTLADGKSITAVIPSGNTYTATIFKVGNGLTWQAYNSTIVVDTSKIAQKTDIPTVSSAITSGDTNPVQGGVLYDKFDEIEQVTAAALNELNDKIEEGGGGNPTVELTQAEYDALVSAGTVSADTYYIITDAQAVDLTNYYTKTETNTLLAGKQATLVSGTNIKTINNESILGSGNISVEGKGVVGGTSITVVTGTTNYTINFTPSIWAGTSSNSIKENYSNNTASGSYSHAEGYNTKATGSYSHAEGYNTTASTYSHAEGFYTTASGNFSHAEGGMAKANGDYSHAEGYNTSATTNYSHAEGYYSTASGEASHAEGYNTKASTDYAHAEGRYTTAQNEAEHASGRYNVSSKANTTFGDSGNTLFSVGNGDDSEYKHNALDIRQNGDIYIVDTSASGYYFDKPMIKLQDSLGGSASTAITSGDTNPVQGGVLYNKFDEIEQVTAAGLNALNDNFGGLKLVKLSQAEYNALATKDSSTLYIIVN